MFFSKTKKRLKNLEDTLVNKLVDVYHQEIMSSLILFNKDEELYTSHIVRYKLENYIRGLDIDNIDVNVINEYSKELIKLLNTYGVLGSK